MHIDSNELNRRKNLVANDWGGILPYFEAFYIFSIIYSAERANAAFSRFRKTRPIKRNAGVITSSVHEALGHSAALSRFFWPSKNTLLSNARAKKLRHAFELSESSSLKNRSLRNAFEHFDERLDDYLLINEAGYFFPTPMIDDHTLADDPTGKLFKLVDPKNGYMVLLGEKYRFLDLIPEVRRILKIAQSMSRHGRLSNSA